MSKYPNWDDAADCCTGGVVGAKGGEETHAGGVDGLDAGAESAGADAGAGVAVEAGADWVSSTDGSSGSSVKTDGASSVGSLTTRVEMGWAGGGVGTASGAGWEIDGAGVGPRADSVPSAKMTSPESGDGPFSGGADAGSAASRMGDSGIGLGIDTAGWC